MNQIILQEDETIDFSDILRTIACHWRLLTIGPLFVGCCVLGITYLIPSTYTAATRFLPPQQQQSAAATMLQSLGTLGGFANAASSLKNPLDQYVALAKSRSVQDALVQKFQLQARYDVELKEDALIALDRNTRISGGKDGLITIEVDDKEPAFSAKLANGYVAELSRLLDRLAITEAKQRRYFFEKQLLEAKINLTKAEQSLKSSGLNNSVLKANPAAAVSTVAQIQAQITAQEVRLASMRGYLTESAPAFKQAQAELQALRSEGDRIASSGNSAKAGDADYIARYRDFKYQETLFELIARQFESAKLDEAREGAAIQVVDVAQPPERKSKPKRGLAAIVSSVLTGAVLAVFVFVRKAMRTSHQRPPT